MKWLYKLERKFGKYAIKGLMRYIVILNAIVYAVMYIDPTGFYYRKFTLIPSLVMQGEIWRLVTYIFIPPATSIFFVFFVLYFYYMIGTSLEQEWGSFRFNLYYLLGMVGTTIAAFLTGGGAGATGTYLNLSLFLAFARIFPDYQILLFFFLPVKVKYLAWVNWFFILYSIFVYPLTLKVVALVSIINYLVFFGKDIIYRTKTQHRSFNNKRRFKTEVPKNFSYHKCTVCGITEKDDPSMEFRYCSTCDGDYEYCMNHLRNHEHITKSKVINFDRSDRG